MDKTDFINAKLKVFEYGISADLEEITHEFRTPNYFPLVFTKGAKEMRDIYMTKDDNFFDKRLLKHLGKVVRERVDDGRSVTYYFTDGTSVWFGEKD